jgi:DNA-binding response OmpR family regulator
MTSILLIEDNVALSRLVEMALVKEGYQVVVTDRGKAGIALLREHPEVSLLITDVVMPEQDGIETIQIARKIKPELRIIVISGDSPKHAALYLKMAGQLGAHRTLLKPFSLTALLATVKDVLGTEGSKGPKD